MRWRVPTPLIIVLQTIAFTFRYSAVLAPLDGFEPPLTRSERDVLSFNEGVLVRVRGSAPRHPASKAGTLLARASPCYLERTRGFDPLFSTPITVHRFVAGVGYVRLEPPAGIDPAPPGREPGILASRRWRQLAPVRGFEPRASWLTATPPRPGESTGINGGATG